MNLVYDVLEELNYQSDDRFSVPCPDGQCSVLPFYSTEFPSQTYLTLEVSNVALDRVCSKEFFSSIAVAFQELSHYLPKMEKNTALLILSARPNEEPLNRCAKIKIEDDPYYFKKYVFSYTKLEETLCCSYLKGKKDQAVAPFSYVREVQAYLFHTTAFQKYKENQENERVYSYLLELATKIPILPLEVTSLSQLKPVHLFVQERVGQDIDSGAIKAIDRLLHSDLDAKEASLEALLEAWEQAQWNM